MRSTKLLFLFCLVVLTAWCQEDDYEDEGGSSAGFKRDTIEPVADPNPFSRPAANNLDEEIRPPEAMQGRNDEDLGPVETLNSDPSEADLKRIQEMDEPPSDLFSGGPPSRLGPKGPVLEGLDSNDPRKQTSAHHHHHHHHHGGDEGEDSENGPKMGHSMHPDGGMEGVAGGAAHRSQGFDSRATVAYDTANKAIEKAKRAAEEAKLAIQAAESAKREAEQVARRGGDGGPELAQTQGLLDISGADIDLPDDSNSIPVLSRAPPEDLEILSSNNDAADLGLPNPNPPSISLKPNSISNNNRNRAVTPGRSRGPSSMDDSLGAVNNAQMDVKTTRRQELMRLHDGLARVAGASETGMGMGVGAMLPPGMPQPPPSVLSSSRKIPERNVRVDEGEGDEKEFQRKAASHHHHHHEHHANHIKLMGDSADD